MNSPSIVSAINGVAIQLKANEAAQDESDRRRGLRERFTIILVLGTFVAAGVSDVIFYRQMVDTQTALAQSQIGERAYMFPEYFKATMPPSPPNEGKIVHISFALKNYGKTPAFFHYQEMSIGLSRSLPSVNAAFGSGTRRNYAIPPLAAGDDTAKIELDTPLPEETLAHIAAGSMNFYGFVRYSYGDIFGKEHECKRAYAIIPSGPSVVIAGGNAYNVCT